VGPTSLCSVPLIGSIDQLPQAVSLVVFLGEKVAASSPGQGFEVVSKDSFWLVRFLLDSNNNICLVANFLYARGLKPVEFLNRM
jgi:hypothetical protein